MALAGIVLLQRHIRRCRIRERLQLVPDSSVDRSCLIMIMQSCSPIIDKALECLSSNDSIAVCKNHRIGMETLDIIGKKVRDCSADTDYAIDKSEVYYEYMLEATEKIAKTSRHIITAPDNQSLFLINARWRQSEVVLSGCLSLRTTYSVVMAIP